VGVAQLPALLGTGVLSVTADGSIPFLLSVGVTMFGLVSIMPFPSFSRTNGQPHE